MSLSKISTKSYAKRPRVTWDTSWPMTQSPRFQSTLTIHQNPASLLPNKPRSSVVAQCVFWRGMTTNGASPAAWQMLPRQWVGCCNRINTSAKPCLVCGVFCLPNPDITLDISETRQQVHDGKLWLVNSIFRHFMRHIL